MTGFAASEAKKQRTPTPVPGFLTTGAMSERSVSDAVDPDVAAGRIL
jgi:hypothetical protein